MNVPTEWQKRILRRLLSVEVPGLDALREQAASAKVHKISDSVSFQIEAHGRKWTGQRVPVEGRATSVDGTPLTVLLHVVDGTLCELEVVRADAKEEMIEFPLEQLEVFPHRDGDWNG
jgi:hypothetical protein